MVDIYSFMRFHKEAERDPIKVPRETFILLKK